MGTFSGAGGYFGDVVWWPRERFVSLMVAGERLPDIAVSRSAESGGEWWW